mmetsp:Transcript_3693/g.11671  ORF Transcript_3693/g.11671 Transcript_3693/m.11671 type:complete len:259 (-) Transcript_3693:111-887(-)
MDARVAAHGRRRCRAEPSHRRSLPQRAGLRGVPADAAHLAASGSSASGCFKMDTRHLHRLRCRRQGLLRLDGSRRGVLLPIRRQNPPRVPAVGRLAARPVRRRGPLRQRQGGRGTRALQVPRTAAHCQLRGAERARLRAAGLRGRRHGGHDRGRAGGLRREHIPRRPPRGLGRRVRAPSRLLQRRGDGGRPGTVRRGGQPGAWAPRFHAPGEGPSLRCRDAGRRGDHAAGVEFLCRRRRRRCQRNGNERRRSWRRREC